MEILSSEKCGGKDVFSKLTSCSGDSGNHKAKKHSSHMLSDTGANDDHAASTDSLKKKRKKLRNLANKTGNQVENILNVSSKPDVIFVQVKEEMQDPSMNLICPEIIDVSYSSNETRIKGKGDIRQEKEDIEGGSQYSLRSLHKPEVSDLDEQGVDPLGNVYTLKNTSATPGDKIEGPLLTLPFPDYEGRSRTTYSYVKVYREGTLRAMAAIANEQAALAAKLNDPFEHVQAKKIIPLEYLDQKPKVSHQIKLNILEQAKVNFQQIASTTELNNTEKMVPNGVHPGESHMTKTGFKNCPNKEETIVMKGFDSSEIFRRTQLGTDEEEESLSEKLTDEHYTRNKVKFGINCKSQHNGRNESQGGLVKDGKLGQLGQVIGKLIENLKSEIERVKPLVDSFSDEGKEEIGHSERRMRQLVSMCKTALLQMNETQMLASKQLGYFGKSVSAFHASESNLNLQAPCYEKGNPAIDPLMPTNANSEESKSVDFKQRMIKFPAIINELKRHVAGEKLSQELSDLLELLETIALIKKFLRKESTDLQNDLENFRVRRRGLQSKGHPGISKLQWSKIEQRTANNLRITPHQPKLKKGKNYLKDLALVKVQVMPRQFLKIQNPTITSYMTRGQNGAKNNLKLHEIEEKMKLEQELAQKQLVAMSLKTKNHPCFLPTTPKARSRLGIIKSLDYCQKERSRRQQGNTTKVSIKVSTAKQKVTTNTQSEITQKPFRKQKQKKISKLSYEELIKTEERLRLEQELAEAQLATL